MSTSKSLLKMSDCRVMSGYDIIRDQTLGRLSLRYRLGSGRVKQIDVDFSELGINKGKFDAKKRYAFRALNEEFYKKQRRYGLNRDNLVPFPRIKSGPAHIAA